MQTLNCTEIKKAHTTVHNELLHCQWGLVSKDGWSLVDDSDNWGLTEGEMTWTQVTQTHIDTYRHK